jgi:AcrR family transcriptional regulator
MSKNERSEGGGQSKQQERPQPRKTDQRIRRTHQRLGSALVELIQEKPMDEVTVQEVLDRAAVGRSTFYLHFRDKNDLWLSQLEQFLEIMSTLLTVRKEKSLRVVPVTEMFAHIGEQKKLYQAMVDAGALDAFYDLAQDYFARAIKQRLLESGRLGKLPKQELSVRAYALAGSLLSLLEWWIDHGAKEPPEEMDRVFHQMVWNGFR